MPLEIARVEFTRRAAQGYQGGDSPVASATATLQPPDATAVDAGLDEDGQVLVFVDIPRTPATNGIEAGDSMTMRGLGYAVKSVERRLQTLEIRAARVERVA